MKHDFLHFLNNQRGVSAVELSLCAPILIALVFGATDISAAYTRKIDLEQGAQRAIELVQRNSNYVTNPESLKNTASIAASVTKNDVTVDVWLECDRIRKTSCTSTQESARYITVVVQDQFNPSFPLYSRILGPITVSGDAALRYQ